MQYKLATLLAILTTNTYAMCYSVYDRDNVLIYESTTSPVPLNSPSLHVAVNKRFPGSAMMINHRVCPHFELKAPQKTAKKTPVGDSLWPQNSPTSLHRGYVERIVVVPNTTEKGAKASVAPKSPAAISPVTGVQQQQQMQELQARQESFRRQQESRMMQLQADQARLEQEQRMYQSNMEQQQWLQQRQMEQQRMEQEQAQQRMQQQMQWQQMQQQQQQWLQQR